MKNRQDRRFGIGLGIGVALGFLLGSILPTAWERGSRGCQIRGEQTATSHIGGPIRGAPSRATRASPYRQLPLLRDPLIRISAPAYQLTFVEPERSRSSLFLGSLRRAPDSVRSPYLGRRESFQGSPEPDW